jgi:hypothetical protein
MPAAAVGQFQSGSFHSASASTLAAPADLIDATCLSIALSQSLQLSHL